jgi:hypothetical protein
MSDKETITVSGVTFSAEHVVSAVVKIDGREIQILEAKQEKKIGYQS